MNERDAIGRRRRPSQNAGLRPLYPPLPDGVRSRSIRVAMSQRAWAALAELVAGDPHATAPVTTGRLLESALVPSADVVVDWQEWQIRKEKGLLPQASIAS